MWPFPWQQIMQGLKVISWCFHNDWSIPLSSFFEVLLLIRVLRLALCEGPQKSADFLLILYVSWSVLMMMISSPDPSAWRWPAIPTLVLLSWIWSTALRRTWVSWSVVTSAWWVAAFTGPEGELGRLGLVADLLTPLLVYTGAFCSLLEPCTRFLFLHRELAGTGWIPAVKSCSIHRRNPDAVCWQTS